MKHFLILFLCAVCVNLNAQNNKLSQQFIRTVVKENGIINYSDGLSPYIIGQIRQALNHDTINNVFYFRTKTDPQAKLILSKNDKIIIANELEAMDKPFWAAGLLKNSRLISTDTIANIFKDDKKGWWYFRDHFGPRLYSFSKPIFLRQNSVCIFYDEYGCGDLCAQGELAVYILKNKKWEKYMILYGMIS